MIIQFENYLGETIGSVRLHQHTNWIDGIDVLGIKGDISVADIDFDDIFNTNEGKIRIQQVNTLRNDIANSIVDDIISCREGELYDEEILDIFTNDYFASELEKVKQLVDEKMKIYLEEDNMTIRRLR